MRGAHKFMIPESKFSLIESLRYATSEVESSGLQSVLIEEIEDLALKTTYMDELELEIAKELLSRPSFSLNTEHLLCNIFKEIPSKYTVHGSYIILCSLLCDGSKIISPKDREFVSKLLSSMPKECFVVKFDSVDNSESPVGLLHRLWSNLRLKYEAPLKSILELSACLDSDILFSRILSFEESKNICSVEYLLDIMIVSGSYKCLTYFLESNPWNVDFTQIDFSYHFAYIGHEAIKAKSASRDYRYCMRLIADKILEPGWQERFPIGLNGENALNWLIAVVPFSDGHLMKCIKRNALSKEEIQRVIRLLCIAETCNVFNLLKLLNTLSIEQVNADDMLCIVKRIAQLYIRTSPRHDTYGRGGHTIFALLRRALELCPLFDTISEELKSKTSVELFKEALVEKSIDTEDTLNFAYAMYRIMDREGNTETDTERYLLSIEDKDAVKEILSYIQGFKDACVSKASTNGDDFICGVVSMFAMSALNSSIKIAEKKPSIKEDKRIYF